VLGRAASATEESAILAAARSFRPLADAARRSATADRLRLASVTTAGAFDEVLPKLGPNAIALEESSILNGLEPGESVMRGQMLKLVTPGRRK
jgi:predicted Zn-dependent protease